MLFRCVRDFTPLVENVCVFLVVSCVLLLFRGVCDLLYGLLFKRVCLLGLRVLFV